MTDSLVNEIGENSINHGPEGPHISNENYLQYQEIPIIFWYQFFIWNKNSL